MANWIRTALPMLLCAGSALAQTGTQANDPLGGPQQYSANPLVAEADRMYARRQQGRVGSRAAVGPISEAIAAYEQAARAPDQVEARWKLVRALYFKGVYTGLDESGRKAVFQKAKRVADEAIEILGRSLDQRGITGMVTIGPDWLAGNLKDRSDAAPSYFWASVAWGEWALSSGKIEAARTGTAEKIRDDSLTVIGIDPDFEEGGGYRILGRLNDQAPWIPFITGWVSHADAIKYLRLAMKVSDRNFVNRHFLAEALYRGDAKDRAEAIALEEGLVKDAPSPQHLVEELKIQDDARQNLSAWK
jgi:tetratricopeptide (TPR) repeat protein